RNCARCWICNLGRIMRRGKCTAMGPIPGPWQAIGKTTASRRSSTWSPVAREKRARYAGDDGGGSHGAPGNKAAAFAEWRFYSLLLQELAQSLCEFLRFFFGYEVTAVRDRSALNVVRDSSQ